MMDFFSKDFKFRRLCKKTKSEETSEPPKGEDRKCFNCGCLLGRNSVSWIGQVFSAEQLGYQERVQCKACERRYNFVDWRTEEDQHKKETKGDKYWKEKLRVFFHETTIHGVRAVAYSKNKIRRGLYLTMVLMFTFLLGRSLFLLTLDYYSYPYIKQYTATVKDSMVFPGITMCNLNEVQSNNKTLSDILINGIVSENFTDPVFSIDAETIYSYLFYTSYDRFSCVFNRVLPCDEYWTNSYMLINMAPFNCISFNVSEPLESNVTGSDNGLILTLSFKRLSDYSTSGVRIFLHDPLRDADELDSSFYAGPGLTTFAVIQPESISVLGTPYHPIEEDCQENGEEFSSYSQVNCKLECRSKYIASECNCLYPFTKGDIRKCSYRDVFTCGKKASIEFKQNESIMKKCHCPPSCFQIKYTTRTSTAYYRNVGYSPQNDEGSFQILLPTNFEIRIYYESFVLKEVSEVPKYQRNEILGQFGGQMGLFLGASLITVVEVIELIFTYILQKCWNLFNNIYK